ncbi:hypothetical protein BDE36_3204 [Arcticibacter tournemirensis]|nr:hypothetical protein [Arcticibacter tournemirensis]TQM51426.1 hypothetical protein BDE36_3204 [Arcticibacter tournemirensis]
MEHFRLFHALFPTMVQAPAKYLCLVIFSALLLLTSSCTTYHEQIKNYYSSISEGDYAKANIELEKSKLLQKTRNRLLYLLEKGRTTHALAQYDTSNHYFNLADKYIEEVRTDAGDALAGTLVNPMMQKYKGEDFEKIMIHYYKALNYLYLGKSEEAIVEARRITLQNQQLNDKFNDKNNRYSKDPFSFMLQGLIYESAADINNAFIAYRNAAEAYLNSENQEYYGIKMPEQLKKDVLRTASQNGFNDEVGRFEKLLNMKYEVHKDAEGGSLVVFWENGLAPVKEQQDFFFSLTKGTSGFYFVDMNGNNIPFDSGVSFNADHLEAADLNNFRVAFPRYAPRPPLFKIATIQTKQDSVVAEKAEDINELAISTLKQRFVKEASLALSRMAVKKAAQMVIKGKDDDNKKNKELREGIAAAIDLYSLFSEKADTRNWQTLPSSIYYARIPLQKGKNDVKIFLRDAHGKEEIKNFSVEGTGKITFYNYASLK